MKTLYFTFDYELYLGNVTGSVENCLIIPTEHLCRVFDKHNVKATFFVDCAYLYMLDSLKEQFPKLDEEFNIIVKNLKWLSSNGHDIQMHFHPQWIYSKYDGITWQLDFTHYKLSDVEPEYLQSSFSKGRMLLEKIVGKEICAYRAGGFCLSDYLDFPTLFMKNHIKIDSSVVPGKKLDDGCVKYNYEKVPTKSVWHFSSNLTKEDPNGCFVEVPISLHKNGKIVYLKHKINELFDKHNNTRMWGDGKSIFMKNSSQNKVKKILNRALWLFRANDIMCSIDVYNSAYLTSMIKRGNSDSIVLVSHPKCLTPEGLNYLEAFLDKYSNQIVCKSISSIL